MRPPPLSRSPWWCRLRGRCFRWTPPEWPSADSRCWLGTVTLRVLRSGLMQSRLFLRLKVGPPPGWTARAAMWPPRCGRCPIPPGWRSAHRWAGAKCRHRPICPMPRRWCGAGRPIWIGGLESRCPMRAWPGASTATAADGWGKPAAWRPSTLPNSASCRCGSTITATTTTPRWCWMRSPPVGPPRCQLSG